MEHLNAEYETLKRDLQENETHSQVQLQATSYLFKLFLLRFRFSRAQEALYGQNQFIPSQGVFQFMCCKCEAIFSVFKEK